MAKAKNIAVEEIKNTHFFLKKMDEDKLSFLYICRAMTWPPRSSSTAECLCLIACLREEQASTASWEPRPSFEVAEMY